ncbi:MAG: MarC family protein [Chloroflexi bacterium]|nr:MarC family protein [Chloroflexota bacterium]MCH7953947.1 MarC family protein [Chloroflexota bacterium]
MGEDLTRTFVAFFVIIDPVGNLVVFNVLSGSMSSRQRLEVAAIAVLAAGTMLVAFAVGGQEVLEFLNISDAAFRIAAGALLLIPAYRMVTQGRFLETAAEENPKPVDVALVPLATPLMAGPGALAAATSLSQSVGHEETITAIVLVLLVSFVAFIAAERVFGLLGESTMRLLTRLVGIILVAIAVQFVIEGLQVSFPGLAE